MKSISSADVKEQFFSRLPVHTRTLLERDNVHSTWDIATGITMLFSILGLLLDLAGGFKQWGWAAALFVAAGLLILATTAFVFQQRTTRRRRDDLRAWVKAAYNLDLTDAQALSLVRGGFIYAQGKKLTFKKKDPGYPYIGDGPRLGTQEWHEAAQVS